jgi:pyruvate-formate lyase
VPDVGNRLFGGSSENQVITLGGLTPDGKSAVNDMTWIFLKATDWSMSNHVAFGLLSSALPSGRRKGQAFTPGLTPSHLSRTALTEQIRAVAGLDAAKMPNNIAFNVKVVPGANDSHGGVVDRMTAYVGAYFEMGGMQMQFNVMSTDTLRAAMARPEEHRDLLVRISGYNAYFVELNRDIQREIIERSEHALGGVSGVRFRRVGATRPRRGGDGSVHPRRSLRGSTLPPGWLGPSRA